MKIMDDMIGALKDKHGKDLAIKLTYSYKKYLVIKEKKAAIAAKKEADRKAKAAKGGKRGGRAQTMKTVAKTAVIVKKVAEKIVQIPAPAAATTKVPTSPAPTAATMTPTIAKALTLDTTKT